MMRVRRRDPGACEDGWDAGGGAMVGGVDRAECSNWLEGVVLVVLVALGLQGRDEMAGEGRVYRPGERAWNGILMLSDTLLAATGAGTLLVWVHLPDTTGAW